MEVWEDGDHSCITDITVHAINTRVMTGGSHWILGDLSLFPGRSAPERKSFRREWESIAYTVDLGQWFLDTLDSTTEPLRRRRRLQIRRVCVRALVLSVYFRP